ncbi:MAG: alpha/beta fold hydrolase [Alphaproteobacteria bacterium]|nr:alpha/beta fold hydrolase [Alphaproteobacteria bacterium]
MAPQQKDNYEKTNNATAPESSEGEAGFNGYFDAYKDFFDRMSYSLSQNGGLYSHEILSKTMAEVQKKSFDHFFHDESNSKQWDAEQKEYLLRLEELQQSILSRLLGAEEKVGPVIVPEKGDRRFRDAGWEENPFLDYVKQAYLLHSSYTKKALDIPSIDEKTKKKFNFYLGAVINAMAPSNFAHLNPEVIRETIESQGENLIKGYKNYLKDQKGMGVNFPSTVDQDAFEVGKNLAITPGSIVFENEIFQLIQYYPQTKHTKETPILIFPPWINKYYIFDLRPENSFVRWNLLAGRTVFIVSWVNPDASYFATSFTDYLLKGMDKAIQEVQKITTSKTVNLVGFCVSGVATAALLSYYAKTNNKSVESATLLATPIDFSHMKELSVFICEDQLQLLEKQLEASGVLAGDYLVKMFSSIRANDLIWPNYINSYLLGKNASSLDFFYWNADTAHLPAKMHLEYLREFFMGNALMYKNKHKINGVEIDFSAIETPVFFLGAKSDHIVPWVSPLTGYNLLPNSTFVLAAAGHVAGVINPPNSGKYCHWVNPTCKTNNPEIWMETAAEYPGSWWMAWEEWLTPYLGGQKDAICVDPKKSIEAAPGRYATEKSPAIFHHKMGL